MNHLSRNFRGLFAFAALCALWLAAPAQAQTINWGGGGSIYGEQTWHGPVRLSGGGSVLLETRPAIAAEAERVTRDPGPYFQASAQRILAEGPAVQIWVRETGWHRVPLSDLYDAGLDRSASLSRLRLYSAGMEEDIWIGDGAIGFFGRAASDTPYSDGRVYWLIEHPEAGRRVAFQSPPPNTRSAGLSFQARMERLERSIYFSGVRNGDESNFFGPVIADEPLEQILDLHHIAPGGRVEIELRFQGVTMGEHYVRVSINGWELDVAAFSKLYPHVQKYVIPRYWLHDGPNTVRVERAGDPDNFCLLDYIRVIYPHLYHADDNRLWFSADGGTQVSLHGFSSDDVRVFDVTNARHVVEVAAAVEPRGGEYVVRAMVPGAGPRSMLALPDSAALSPSRIQANRSTSLSRGFEQGQFLIISHERFLETLGPLKALRESQGYSVVVIDVQDLYDEFSYGQKSPFAIRNFFLDTHDWEIKPRYALLVGDATFDPKDYAGRGDADFVPTKLVDGRTFETASDDWYTDENNDGIAELPIGRLPVRTLEEAHNAVDKLVRYAQAEPGDWRSEALFVSDVPDTYNFPAASGYLASLLPGDMTDTQIVVNPFAPDETRSNLLEALNRGQLMVSYTGHGGPESWSQHTVLTSPEALQLQNGDRLPFVTAMTCVNGLFHDVVSESLAEALLKAPDGGAIAVWSSAGIAETLFQTEAATALFGKLFREGATLGEAVRAAKLATADPDTRRTWNLLGDPSVRLRVFPK